MKSTIFVQLEVRGPAGQEKVSLGQLAPMEMDGLAALGAPSLDM